jgi:hypothetical protein
MATRVDISAASARATRQPFPLDETSEYPRPVMPGADAAGNDGGPQRPYEQTGTVMYHKSCIRIQGRVTDMNYTLPTPDGGRPRDLGESRSNDNQSQGSER